MRCSGQGLSGLFHHGAEGLLVVDGQVGQNLAVQSDFRLAQTCDQPAVAQAVCPAGCIDPGNPQRAKLPLALAAVTVGILTSLDDRLLGHSEGPRAGPVVAPGLLEDLFVTTTRHHTAFYTSHVLHPRYGDHQSLSMRFTSATSAGLTCSVPRSWRLRLVVILVRMWDFIAKMTTKRKRQLRGTEQVNPADVAD